MKKILSLIAILLMTASAIFAQEISDPSLKGFLVKGGDGYYLRFEKGLGGRHTLFAETIILITTYEGKTVKLSALLENVEKQTENGRAIYKGVIETSIGMVNSAKTEAVNLPLSESQILDLKAGIKTIKINTFPEVTVMECKNEDKNPGAKIYKKYLELKEF